MLTSYLKEFYVYSYIFLCLPTNKYYLINIIATSDKATSSVGYHAKLSVCVSDLTLGPTQHILTEKVILLQPTASSLSSPSGTDIHTLPSAAARTLNQQEIFTIDVECFKKEVLSTDPSNASPGTSTPYSGGHLNQSAFNDSSSMMTTPTTATRETVSTHRKATITFKHVFRVKVSNAKSLDNNTVKSFSVRHVSKHLDMMTASDDK